MDEVFWPTCCSKHPCARSPRSNYKPAGNVKTECHGVPNTRSALICPPAGNLRVRFTLGILWRTFLLWSTNLFCTDVACLTLLRACLRFRRWGMQIRQASITRSLSLIDRTLSNLSAAHLPMLVGGRFLVLCLLSAALDIHLSAYGCWCKPEISAEVSFLQRPHLLKRCTGCQLGVHTNTASPH